jgi:hypothetical protein
MVLKKWALYPKSFSGKRIPGKFPLYRKRGHGRILLFLSQLLYFLAVLNLVNENFGRLEAWNKVLVYYQGSIAGNIPGDLLLPLFVDKAAESADVNVISAGHGRFHNAKECFYGCGHISLVNSGLLSDFVDDICFGHCVIFLGQKNFGIANLCAAHRIKNEY